MSIKKQARSRLDSNQLVSNKKNGGLKNLSLMGQIVFLLGGGIGLIVLFVMIVLPKLIEWTANIKMMSEGEKVKTQILQAPIVNAPAAYTSESELILTGYAVAGSTLQLVRNGQKDGQMAVPENGEFSWTVKLNDGENSFAFYVINQQGDESKLSQSFRVILDQEVPTITLDELAGEIVGRDNQSLTIVGITEAEIDVYINERLIRSNNEGRFSGVIHLEEGENNIAIRVEDRAGNQNELITKVDFRL